jgi:hypothetical protein
MSLEALLACGAQQPATSLLRLGVGMVTHWSTTAPLPDTGPFFTRFFFGLSHWGLTVYFVYLPNCACVFCFGWGGGMKVRLREVHFEVLLLN